MSNAPVDPGFGARQILARMLETVFGQAGAFAQTRPYADPQQQTVATLLSFGSTARVVEGVIMDSTTVAHCYKVHVEKGRAPVLAYHGTQTSLTISGARQLNTFTPGTRVMLVLHNDNSVGTIICAIPFRGTAANRSLADQIHLASRTRVDEMEKRPLKMVGSSNIPDYMSGRPFDSLGSGEAGWITSTGLRLTIDDFMVQLASSEMCGVTAFYHDMLLRLAGYNLQQWAAGMEHEHIDDEGECDDTRHYAPFPWEAYGLFQPGDPRVTLTPEITQLSQPYYAAWEPKSDRQQPFARDKHYHGYLGQGGRTLLIAPPPSPPEVWQYKPGTEGQAITAYTSGSSGGGKKPADPSYQEKPPIGLHQDNVAMDGRRFMSSAKGIVISKRMLIPDATRRKRPNSDDGDNATNYKASSKFGGGPDHKITGDIKTTNEKHPTLQRAAAVLDLHAYLFNYSGLHPFHYHEKDYRTWEEQDLEHAKHDQIVPSFLELGSSMYLSPPAKKMVKIDHRYGAQEFYETESFISLLEDGGIVIADGAGAEMRMAGGSLTFSAPGDVWFKPGRNLMAWTGRDSIFRSKGSIDFSTTEKTIRFKAEKDVMITSGNGGVGGVLIESRATSPDYEFDGIGDDVQLGGVVLRAKNAEVVALAPAIYLRTVGDEKTPAQDITIDCDRGKRNIVVNAHSQMHYAQGGIYHFFGPENEIEAANMFSKDFNTLCAHTGVGGPIGVIGHVINQGWVLTAEGHIATELAEQFSYFVAPLEGRALAEVKDYLGQIDNVIHQQLPKIGDAYYDYNPEQLWYADKRPGNEAIINKIEFSFRTSEQYRIANDFVVFEDRWQQLARIGEQSLQNWEEKPVKTRVDPENYPFPGKDKFKEEVYLEQDLDLYIYEEGGFRSRKRATSHDPLVTEPKYEDPKYLPPTKKKLNGNYPIIG